MEDPKRGQGFPEMKVKMRGMETIGLHPDMTQFPQSASLRLREPTLKDIEKVARKKKKTVLVSGLIDLLDNIL